MFAEMGSTTIMMVLFFGANSLLFILFQLIKRSINSHMEVEEKKRAAKELSKPFNATMECFTNLTSELFRTGLIMTLTYMCEKHPFFPHSSKSYSRDLFLFVLIIFFGYAFMTIKPVHDTSLLGREQTEEWKGWMQFIFLLYHYFHAEEVYNSVRVMITCLDDWLRKFFILLYEAGLRMVASCPNALETQFLGSFTNVDSWKHIYSLLHMPHAYFLLYDGVCYYVRVFWHELHQMGCAHQIDSFEYHHFHYLGCERRHFRYHFCLAWH
jgi:hypothetical protein